MGSTAGLESWVCVGVLTFLLFNLIITMYLPRYLCSQSFSFRRQHHVYKSTCTDISRKLYLLAGLFNKAFKKSWLI